MNRRQRRILVLCCSALLCVIVPHSIDGQEETTLEKVRGLGLSSIPDPIPAFYSEGYMARAQFLQGVLGRAVDFFSDSFGVEVSLNLAILNEGDWVQVSGTLPYGALYVTGRPHLVVLPATTDVPVTQDFLGPTRPEGRVEWLEVGGLSFEEAAKRMVDLVGFHEVGHTFREALGIPRVSNWFNEFLASYLAYAFMRAEEPILAGVWNGMMHLKAGAERPSHTTLDDFQELYFGVGLENYVWYQSQFQERVHEVYEASGLGFVSLVVDSFSSMPEQLEDEVALRKLEEIVPGFLEWAEVFRSGDQRPDAGSFQR